MFVGLVAMSLMVPAANRLLHLCFCWSSTTKIFFLKKVFSLKKEVYDHKNSNFLLIEVDVDEAFLLMKHTTIIRIYYHHSNIPYTNLENWSCYPLYCNRPFCYQSDIVRNILPRGEIHQALFSLFSLLAEFFIEKVPIKD